MFESTFYKNQFLLAAKFGLLLLVIGVTFSIGVVISYLAFPIKALTFFTHLLIGGLLIVLGSQYFRSYGAAYHKLVDLALAGQDESTEEYQANRWMFQRLNQSIPNPIGKLSELLTGRELRIRPPAAPTGIQKVILWILARLNFKL